MTIMAAEDDLPAPTAETVRALRAEIAQLREELARMSARLAEAEGLADRDALTPLLNRRALLRELDRARTYAARYAAKASLVYFDVDGLKAVNDQLGHAAGDAVLQAVAARLSAQVRASDAVGRLGGDEFAVLLMQTDGFQAEAKAQALAEAIAGAPISGLGAPVRVTVSWGVAEIRPQVEAEAVLAEADAAMYAARRARPGRRPGR